MLVRREKTSDKEIMRLMFPSTSEYARKLAENRGGEYAARAILSSISEEASRNAPRKKLSSPEFLNVIKNDKFIGITTITLAAIIPLGIFVYPVNMTCISIAFIMSYIVSFRLNLIYNQMYKRGSREFSQVLGLWSSYRGMTEVVPEDDVMTLNLMGSMPAAVTALADIRNLSPRLVVEDALERYWLQEPPNTFRTSTPVGILAWGILLALLIATITVFMN